MSKFGTLVPHLADAGRREQLLKIESELKEHAFPPQVVIENTSYCNLKCIHCSHRAMIRPQRHMERALWEKIVTEIATEAPNTEVWPTFYGEALILGDELWDRLDFAHNAGCRNLVLNSNGTLLNRNENIEKILESPLKRFILSLDGLKKETFEKIRAKAKWDQVYPAVAALLKRKEETGKEYPSIIAQFSVMEQNLDEISEFRKYWSALGAEVKIRPMLEWTATGPVRSKTIIHDNEFRIACPWVNSTMAIHQDGSVVACAVDYEGRFVAGNAKDESLKAIWMRLKTQLRDVHKEHRFGDLPELCKACGDWQAAGAEYEEETVPGTRPFWYYEHEDK